MSTPRTYVRLSLAIALATLAVALAGSQSAQALTAPVLIDGVTVDGGVAILTGTADSELVQVNGQAIQVEDDGTFQAVIDLSDNVLVLEVLESAAETVSIRVPIDVLLATGGDGVLDDLVDAGISIDRPVEGFRIVDGQLPLVEGRVLNDSNLSVLRVNGVDVLGSLGKDGLFSVDLGSSSKRETVTVVATDHRGVSQTSTFSTTRVRSTIATRAGTSVSAAGARGIVVAKVALDQRFLKPSKLLRIVVTVKDRRGYLVRGASVRLHAVPSRHVANGAVRAAFTNRAGKARFALRLRAAAPTAAKWTTLTFSTHAATPKASATKRVALRLPAAVLR